MRTGGKTPFSAFLHKIGLSTRPRRCANAPGPAARSIAVGHTLACTTATACVQARECQDKQVRDGQNVVCRLFIRPIHLIFLSCKHTQHHYDKRKSCKHPVLFSHRYAHLRRGDISGRFHCFTRWRNLRLCPLVHRADYDLRRVCIRSERLRQ